MGQFLAAKWIGNGAARLAGLVVLAGSAGAMLAGCGGDGGEPESELSAPQGNFACPGQLTVGIPYDLELRVRNPGDVPYPATFVSLDAGFDRFVVDSVTSKGSRLQPADVTGFGDTYVTTGAGVRGRSSRTITVSMTPIQAGNVDLEFYLWGAGPNEIDVPGNAVGGNCKSVPVNP